MDFNATRIRFQTNDEGQAEIILTIRENPLKIRQEVSKWKELIAKGKKLSVEIKQYRKHRSLDANAYMWKLLSEMAAVLHTTKDELYLLMLDRYGVFTHVIVKPEAVDRVKDEWRTVRVLGEIEVNGKTGVQLQCYYGSSTYTTKEMSVLIDGVVNECKELGIETMTPEQLSALKQSWGKQDKAS